MMGRKYFYSH